MRLDGLTDWELCQTAKVHPPHAGTTTVTAQHHLTSDPLILWAVSDARVPAGPSGGQLAPATALTTEEWIEHVNAWFESGAHCGL